jgi:hypothetical protein
MFLAPAGLLVVVLHGVAGHDRHEIWRDLGTGCNRH